ncbi:MAG: hypothetical protein KAS63_00515 [Candidatus Heimdallarchaeota archaeon]|nr:hypothetical protein [Candidatus Heimdallarchaeota archaeon]MCK4953825.1 hypothetical protein [Candidatus Heimdallarchaeota archaeon]
MSDEYFNPEIINKIEENTDKIIKKILAEQEEIIANINKETEEKIKESTENIISVVKKSADAEFLREKAKHDLDLRLKITKFRDELVDDFINKATEKIKTLTSSKEYITSLEKMILEAAVTLKQPKLLLYRRKEDKDIFSKQFLENISTKLKNENNIDVKFDISNNFINCMGGTIAETADGKISINNTYEKRIERSLGNLKRELSLLLTQEG